MLVPLVISSVAAGLLSVTSYFPYKNHLKLHGDSLDATSLASNHVLNLEHCHPVSTRLPNEPAGPVEPSFCEDVVLDRRTGMAYLSCDPTRLTWDARAGIFEDGGDKLAREQGTPGIWAWDTSRRSLARKLYISTPPPEYPLQAPADLLKTFHPLGIAVTASNPYFVEEVDEGAEPRPQPPANLVVVANKPYADKPGVVDIFVHDLDKVGGKDHATLRWIKRVEGHELTGTHVDTDMPFKVDPFRVAIFAEQYSQPIDRDYPEPQHVKDNPDILAGFKHDDVASKAARTVRIPSFFVTSFPDRTKEPPSQGISERSSLFSAVWQPVASYLLPQYSLTSDSVTSKLFIHHSSINRTLSVRLDGSDPDQWHGFPPLLQAWDGGGKAAGSNSSAIALFIPTLTVDSAKVQEWEQHWVRGIAGGIRDHRVLQKATTPDGRPNNVLQVYKTYTPSFVNFFAVEQETPVRALVVDEHGRSWTAGNPNTRSVEKWIASQRDERRRRLGLPTSSPALSSSERPPRPAAKIDQTTFVFRHLGSVVAHPWDKEKLKTKRKKGVFLRKEFHTFNVFKSPAETKAEIEGRSEEEMRKRGWLPTVPTGLAVDIHKKLLYVTGAYEERGFAVCALPADWIEA
ncbi:Serum paraoxonase/arylesterase [Pseudozyma hubeiensis]|nr:Serum paraoxonase/arylesterase [Pseudozyma hubeiensis]